MKKLSNILIALAITCIVAMGAVYIIYGGQFLGMAGPIKENHLETVKVYGQKISPDSENITINGENIANFDELSAELAPFKKIQYLNLGKYELTVSQKESLEARYPGIKIESTLYIPVWGKKIYVTDREFDARDLKVGTPIDDADDGIRMVTLADLEELTAALHKLPALKKVILGSTRISYEDRCALEEEFPKVKFDIVSVVDIGGKTFNTDIEYMDLSKVKLEKDFYLKLKNFDKLDVVDARNQDFTQGEKYTIIKECPKIKFIWEIIVKGDKIECSDIENLDLTGIRLSFDEIEALIPLFPFLERIDMTDTGYTDDELAEFREKINKKYKIEVAWTVRMGQWSLKTDQVAFSVLIYTYNYRRLTTNDIQVLKYCNKLQALDLGHQAISDISVIGDYLPNLKVLILADNALRDITPISKLKHLHYVELFVNSISDISPLGECKELVDVNIGWNYYSDITALLDLPLLERLWIINTGVSGASQELLKETYPDAKLTFSGKNSLANGWRDHERYAAMMHGWYSKCITEAFLKYDGLVVKD